MNKEPLTMTSLWLSVGSKDLSVFQIGKGDEAQDND